MKQTMQTLQKVSEKLRLVETESLRSIQHKLWFNCNLFMSISNQDRILSRKAGYTASYSLYRALQTFSEKNE